MQIDFTEEIKQKGSFKMYLQPKHNPIDGSVIGAESLSRFVDNKGNLFLPGEYIDDLEKNGKIADLDFYILDNALEFLADWDKTFKGIKMIPVSVNFSKHSLEREDFVDRFLSVAEKHNVPAEFVEIEITENFRFQCYENVGTIFERLRNYGYKISIDDYGKNSSAFSIIRHFDVDILKIDREIILESARHGKIYMIFEAVTSLAKKLGIKTVAEGIETEEQLKLAVSLGCDGVQGWYYSKAMPEDEFVEFVKNVKLK